MLFSKKYVIVYLVSERNKMNRPTRFYSNKQEKKVAKAIGGKQTANSGATLFIDICSNRV